VIYSNTLQSERIDVTAQVLVPYLNLFTTNTHQKRGKIQKKEMENEGNGGTVTGLCIHINLIVSMHKYFNSITIAVLYGPTNTEAYYITLHILHRPSGRRRRLQGESYNFPNCFPLAM